MRLIEGGPAERTVPRPEPSPHPARPLGSRARRSGFSSAAGICRLAGRLALVSCADRSKPQSQDLAGGHGPDCDRPGKPPHDFQRQQHHVPAHRDRRRPRRAPGPAERARRPGRPARRRQAADRLHRRRRRGPGLSDRLPERGDRRPVRPRPRAVRAGLPALSRSEDLPGLPGDVRQRGEEFRRPHRRHAGPLAFPPRAGGPGDEQAHLLRQAGHPHDRGGAAGEGRGPGFPGHHQAQHPGLAHLRRAGHHRTAAERGHRSGPGGALLDRHALPERPGPAGGDPDSARPG